MNIFALDSDPIEAARKVIWKKHIVKMPLESAQMLSTALRLLTDNNINFHNPENNVFSNWYFHNIDKIAYPNHPCTVWVRTSYDNFNWLVEHSLELCKIYTSVYDKTHRSELVIKVCKDNALPEMFPNKSLTPFALCVDDVFKVNVDTNDINSVISAYNEYYTHVKIPKAKPNELLTNLYY